MSGCRNRGSLLKEQKVLCFSSFTYGYLSRARTLFKSLRNYHPSWTLAALVVDELAVGGHVDIALEPFDHLVTLDDLAIPDIKSWLFGHDVVEACTAVKGPYLLQALTDGRYDIVIYLDPDTCLFDSLDPVIASLEHRAIVLTPHQLRPADNPMQIVDDEIGSLKFGIFNLGFVAVARSDEGLRFARWWTDRLLSYCHDDVGSGLFVDQRWCDHVPVFFGGVHILKDEGYNVASWNIAQRRLKFDESGGLSAAGQPLRFCHFTKVGAVGDVMLRKNAGENFEAHEVWAWYHRELERNAYDGLPSGWWAFNAYQNGETIKPADRRLYRRRSDLRKSFPDPFASGRSTFQTWLGEHARATDYDD